MFRLDLAHHVVRTVQGVTQSILVGSIMQTFNHTWEKKERYLKLSDLISLNYELKIFLKSTLDETTS